METPVSRSALYGKLAGPLFRSLESATAFCKLRSNPWVELTHWLHQLTQQPDNDILHVLRHYQIPLSDVEKALLRQLDMLPAGASAISDFSHHIDLSVEKAWMLASVRYGDNKIRSGWLLLALLTMPELRRVLSSICAPLATLPVDELTEILPSLIETSPEAQERPYDGSGLASAIPGESSQAIPNGGQDGKSALAKYCQDMTAQARDGKIDPVTGREHEIRTMTDILLRRRQNNPLLTGEAGVGKTAVVEGFALAIAQGEVPPALREVRLLALDVGALLAGASMKGEFESRLKGLLLRPYTARCGSAWLYRQSRRVGPCAVYCRGFPLGTANGLLAGAGESPRPDQNRHPEPGICAVELAAGQRRLPLYWPDDAAFSCPPAVWRKNQPGGRV